MPTNRAQVCSACGSPLDVPVQGGKIKCPFCGTVNIVEARETRQGDEIICPECGASNPKDAQHCGRCGIKLEINCPKCNAVNPYGTVYCVKCGVDIQDETKRQQDELKLQQAEDIRIHQQVLQQEANTKRKQRMTTLAAGIVIIAILLCVVVVGGSWYYRTNLSPAAHSTQTALAFGQTATAKASILFSDDFSDPNSGWDEYTSANGSAGYDSGGYLIHVIKPNWMVWDSPSSNVFQNDVRIEVDATKTAGQDDSSQFGVACRYQDQDNFYFLALSSDGYAAIFLKSQGKFTNLSSADNKWTSVDGIYGGSETNHVRAECIGSDLALYSNGVLVVSATDNTFSGGGVALIGGTFDTGGTSILFDNFTVYRP
jgi:LSD1 subclass zinc finger protein